MRKCKDYKKEYLVDGINLFIELAKEQREYLSFAELQINKMVKNYITAALVNDGKINVDEMYKFVCEQLKTAMPKETLQLTVENVQ